MTAAGPFALALVAGVISFTSPCCLPLMPGYLSYVGGVAGSAVDRDVRRGRVLGSAALFVLGFTVVFTALGVGASRMGAVLLGNREALISAAGLLVIVMGVVTMGLVRIPLLARERRMRLHRLRPGPAGAVPLGMAFAVGWTPCIGPVLAGILTAAATAQHMLWGGALLFTYSLGLGIPFLLLAIGYSSSRRPFAWLRRHGRGVEVTGGLLLVLMGVLMVTGAWLQLFAPLLRLFSRTGWPPI